MNQKIVRRALCGMLLFTNVFIPGLFYNRTATGAERQDILAVGEGTIKDNNMAGARKDAISDALKKGIEQYLSQYLGSQGMTANFTELINNIAPFAVEDIENYQILTEDKRDEKYSILVSVKVNEKLMEQRLKDVGIVSIEAASINILFLVSQENAAGKELSFWWNNPEGAPALTTTELKLYNIFQEQGLEPINRLSNIPYATYSEDMRKMDISDAAAIEWGKIYSADVIIKGRCSLSADNAVAVDLEAIKAGDGKSICRASIEEIINPAGAGEDGFMNALHRAINSIAVQFVPRIIKSFEKTDGELNKIMIRLEDVNNFEEFRVFKKFLEEEIGGIKSVVQSRIKGNSITVSVEFSGTKEAFIKKLKSSGRFPVQADITDVEGGDLVITIEHEMMDSTSNRNLYIQ